MSTATPEEQLMLELINRARMDPHAEMQALFNTGQGNIDFAVSFFANYADQQDDGLDNDSYTAADLEAQALSEVLGLPALAPMNWNDNLATSAATHNDLMIAEDTQSHNLPGEPGYEERFTNGGYDLTAGWAIGESIYGYTQDPLHGHAGYYIDWGFTPTGIQTPAGHRNSILSSTFTEVGIAYKDVPAGQSLGPYSNTQHFGYSSNNPSPYILGVTIDDLDNDDFYDIGEGLSGVTITATGAGGTFTTTSFAAGGYQLVVAPNSTYTVTFSGSAIGATQSFTVVVGTENVKQDAEKTAPAGPTNGDDILSGTSSADTIDLLDGNDEYTAGSGGDSVNGGAGNDLLLGQGGNDTLEGDAGEDTALGGAGEDLLIGGDGIDRLFGEGGNDTINGDDGNDRLSGSSGDDLINGGDGNDLIQGQGNNDTMNGGLGDDTINGQAGLDDITGGFGDDLILGGGAADFLNGNDGDDTIDGGTERDFIGGGVGNDSLIGGGGRDTLDGGADHDSMSGGADYDLLAGGSGNDTMDGGGGQDTVNGGLGNDSMSGGTDNDTLDGGAGVDTLDGGNGADLLSVASGEGGDILTGGSGADTFDFESGFGTAFIEDFSSVDTVDLIDVTTATAFGDLAITYSNAGATANVDAGGGDILTMNNLTFALTAGDFSF